MDDLEVPVFLKTSICVPLSPQTICPAESAESDDVHIFQPKAQGFHFHSESFPFSLLVFLPVRRCMDRGFNPGLSMGPRASQSFSQRFTATILMCKKTTRFLFNIETIRALTAATVSSLQALHPALPEHQQLGNPWGTWTFAHDMRDPTMPDQDMIQASSTTIKINGI